MNLSVSAFKQPCLEYLACPMQRAHDLCLMHSNIASLLYQALRNAILFAYQHANTHMHAMRAEYMHAYDFMIDGLCA